MPMNEYVNGKNAAVITGNNTLFITAAGFADLGGWVIDQRSIAQIGSSYIMAHGMGTPVADARTPVVIPKSGNWIVWAKTRDWTAVWKRGSSAGKFQITVNGDPLPEILGTNGNEWNWQKAGMIYLENGEANISLHDLTGFNGRCCAVYLTMDNNEKPDKNNIIQAENALKLIENTEKQYDLAVIGGGYAGICAAYAAASTGSRVAFIHDREILGGCSSSEVKVGVGGYINVPPYPNMGNVVERISPVFREYNYFLDADFFEDARRKNIFRLLPKDTYDFFLNEYAVAVEKNNADNTLIDAVIIQNVKTGLKRRIKAKVFADCSGDAVIARMMNAQLMYGREGRGQFNESLAPEKADNMVMGHSVIWYTRESNQPVAFPDVDWGIEINEDNVFYVKSGGWEWECGQFRDQADEAEYIRDYGLMTIYATWSFLKNHSVRRKEWEKTAFEWVSAIGGKRESYRVVGDMVLTQNDVENHIPYPDATASMSWNIDLHVPDPEHLDKFKEPFRSCAYHRQISEPYQVPLRCLYAKGIKNLFLGGRIISLTHVAFAAARVMRTLGMLGEVIGMAASVCRERKIYPHEIFPAHFERLDEMMRNGIKFELRCTGMTFGSVNETYHFAELDKHVQIRDLPIPDEKIMNKIRRLNIDHKYKG